MWRNLQYQRARCMPESNMPVFPVHAPAIPLMSLDSPSDSAVNSLYRAALGPVNAERYLPEFARLDAMGRTLTSWNWAACVFTLGWMVYRQLWSAALVYVAVAEAVALLVFGLGRPLLQWPQAVEWGVVGAFIVAGSVIPGLYANALLHADIRKRVTKALAASATIPEGCVLLSRQAPSRKRLTWVIAGHALVVVAALAAYFFIPQGSSAQAEQVAATPAPDWNTPSPTLMPGASRAAAASGTVAAGASDAKAAGEAALATAAPSLSAPASTTVPTHQSTSTPAAAAAPEAESTPAPTTATASAPARPGLKSKEPKERTTTPNPLQSRNAADKEALRQPEKEKAATPSSATAAAPTTKAKDARETRDAKEAREAKTAKPAAKASVAASKPRAAEAPSAADGTPTVGSAAGYYINVGLFADEANARKAQSRLLNEGLPAFRQTLDSAKGTRTRVRVGPYSTRAEADSAASSIRAMELDAVVFRKER